MTGRESEWILEEFTARMLKPHPRANSLLRPLLLLVTLLLCTVHSIPSAWDTASWSEGGCGARVPGLKCDTHHLRRDSWKVTQLALCLSFLTCNMGMTITPMTEDGVKINELIYVQHVVSA